MAIANQTQQQTISHHDLYEQDFCLWIERAVKLLSENRLSELDRENLIEEISDMGSSQRQALRSNLEVVLMHLLKYKYQPEKRSNSWRGTLVEHRFRLQEMIEDSPSLSRFLLESIDKCYFKARKRAAAETAIGISIFPMELPFTASQVLDEDYLPE